MPEKSQSEDDVAAIEQLGESYAELLRELNKVIYGQTEVMEKILTCILAQGHGLLMGVPGLAKTLLVRCLSDVLNLDYSRVQFTPDLMPSDITGTDILQQDPETNARRFEFAKGPVFANIVLADEINRTPPKTQAALLEAMQEHHITVLGRCYKLDPPFFVLATQNPIEQEGTYPLPEAQLDRFMFFIRIDYPDREEEKAIAQRTTGGQNADLAPVLSRENLLYYQDLVRRIPVPEHIYDYAVNLVRRSRPGKDAPQWVKSWITWGAGPRAVQYLILGAKARAALHGSYMARVDDVEALAPEVLSHRIQLSFHAESEGMSSLDVVQRLVEEAKSD